MNHHAIRAPRLLVSVRDAQELAIVSAGGADWIDLKEPREGPLAAVEVSQAKLAIEALPAGKKLSAALGELRDWDQVTTSELLSLPAISVVKLGLAGCADDANWQNRWRLAHDFALAYGKHLAAVVYADWKGAHAPAPREVLNCAADASCRYLLVDTFEKDGRSTFDFFSDNELRELLDAAQNCRMQTVLAGSLTTESIAYFPIEQVNIVAVRGAVCLGDRADRVDAGLVGEFRQALHDRYSKFELSASHDADS
ncbi:MAG: (5-formylfuran-3-yl)methyl phosphate synthase [Planctomycetota bacterium]